MSARVAPSPDGRWGGRITQREMPSRDEAIEALPPGDRERLAGIWLARAAMERRVGDSFEVVHGALVRRGAPASLVAIAHRAVDDEIRHTELSRVVASRYAGHELALRERLKLDPPRHEGASPELRDTLHVIGQCVLNETTAGAYLEACLDAATAPTAEWATRELLSDEIEHGRVGWAYLASRSQEERAAVAPWLLPMAFLNLREWQRETPLDPDYPAHFAAHGAPDPVTLRAALVGALRDLIVPGLRALAIDTSAIDAWLADGADTSAPPPRAR